MKHENSLISEEKDDEDLTKIDSIPEAVLQDLVTAYERVSLMNKAEIIAKLKCFHIDIKGNENVLRENLKTSYKKIILNGKDLSLSRDLLPYYVVVDFEATCQDNNPYNYRHEIIEFPAVLVNSKKQEIVDCFQMYCKPHINPILTEFCTRLTGITQEQVDTAEAFDKVIMSFQNWLLKHHLGSRHKFCLVTDGPFDMSRFLYSQCHYSKIQFPKWANKWVNLKKTFSKFYKCQRLDLTNMLDYLGMSFTGRLHCGIDDAKNIARILLRMIYDGANIQINEVIVGMKKQENKTVDKDHKCLGLCRNGEKHNDDIQNVRVEARYKPIYYAEQMPVYKRTRKERLIAETQLARKILRNPNEMEDKSATNKTIKSRKKEG